MIIPWDYLFLATIPYLFGCSMDIRRKNINFTNVIQLIMGLTQAAPGTRRFKNGKMHVSSFVVLMILPLFQQSNANTPRSETMLQQ